MATMRRTAGVANTAQALARLGAAGPFPAEIQPFIGFITRSRLGITQ